MYGSPRCISGIFDRNWGFCFGSFLCLLCAASEGTRPRLYFLNSITPQQSCNNMSITLWCGGLLSTFSHMLQVIPKRTFDRFFPSSRQMSRLISFQDHVSSGIEDFSNYGAQETLTCFHWILQIQLFRRNFLQLFDPLRQWTHHLRSCTDNRLLIILVDQCCFVQGHADLKNIR